MVGGNADMMGRPNINDGAAGAVEHGRYRYLLWRTRLDLFGAGAVVWVMLNPSTADAKADDPTIRRCLTFTHAAGYRHLIVVNLYAARHTDPHDLIADDDPVGPWNAKACAEAIADADEVVFAWGAWAGDPRLPAPPDVHAMVARRGLRPRCLGVTAAGQPRHPLYVHHATPLQYFGAELT